MKARLIILLVVLFLGQLAYAQTYELDTKNIKAQISKIRVQIDQLKAKAKKAPKAQAKKYQTQINGAQARIDKLMGKLATLEKQKIAKQKKLAGRTGASLTIEAIGSEEAIEIPSFESEALAGEEREKRVLFQVGGNLGLFGDTTGALGEIRVPMGFIFGPAKTSLRLEGGLLQSADMTRRFAPIMFDLILNYPAGWFTGVENYLGVGLNYICKMSGSRAGTVGGQVCYGIQSDGFGGTLYGEIGWAVMRTGFSPSQKGTTVLFGYRLPWLI